MVESGTIHNMIELSGGQVNMGNHEHDTTKQQSNIPHKIDIRVFSDNERLARGACDYLLERVLSYARQQEVVHIAFSGGSTPKVMFEYMVSDLYITRFPWKQLYLYFVDERMVPPNHPDSNYHMFQEATQGKIPLAPEQLIRINGELVPSKSAELYQTAIQNSFHIHSSHLLSLDEVTIPVFDIIQLGMGDDGHTASLFPYTEGIKVQDEIVIANYVPKFDKWRVTLTAAVIQHAKEVFFLIAGSGKAQVLKEVLEGDFQPERYPTQLITSAREQLTFLLDKDAARKIEG